MVDNRIIIKKNILLNFFKVDVLSKKILNLEYIFLEFALYKMHAIQTIVI